MKCIEFPFGGYHYHDEYCEYLKSHKWKTIFTEGNGIMEQCEDCKCLMQHASGTINFRFGCSMIEDIEQIKNYKFKQPISPILAKIGKAEL